MRIQNLNASLESAKEEALVGGQISERNPVSVDSEERQRLEIALLKARILHLELVVETARSLMGSNQERLLRQLHEVPREMATLGAQLRRIDPQASW